MKDILEKRPFRMQIDVIEPLSGQSGGSFMVVSCGRKYKLRICRNRKKAKRIERNVNLLPNCFPRCIGRDGSALLFEWIEGEHVQMGPTKEISYEIGKMLGQAHALGNVNADKDPDEFFHRKLKTINRLKIFTEAEVVRLEQVYKQMRENVHLVIATEFRDLNRRNFLMDERRKLYFVDEKGFGDAIKGFGLAKALLVEPWIVEKEEQEAFWSGYREYHGDDYFDTDYQALVAFLQVLASISAKGKKDLGYARHMKALAEMLGDGRFRDKESSFSLA